MFQISIVIRSKNEGLFINKTLSSLFQQNLHEAFEVILVDSGSTDDTLNIAGKYDVKIFRISEEDFSYGYALNYGIGKASGEIIVCLSAHCAPADDKWLAGLISPLRLGKVHATFGRQLPVKGVNPFEEVSLSKHFPPVEKKNGRVPFSNANCAFLKTMWLERKFDEELPSWEDYLWYLLQRDSYIFQYSPEAAVYHTHSFSIGSVSARAYKDGRAFRIIKDKYGMDLIGELTPSVRSKAMLFLDDMKDHLDMFRKRGYKKHILLLPVVKFLVYQAYLRGYRSKYV